MGWLRRQWKFFDPDDWFAFGTGKRVIIRDRRLGFLHLALQVVVWVYVIYFTVLAEHGYKRVGTPDIEASFSFRGPCCNTTNQAPEEPPYRCDLTCDPASYVPPEQFSYCRQSNSSAARQLTCMHYDPLLSHVVHANTLTVLTRVQTDNYGQKCDIHDPSFDADCLPTGGNRTNLFIADVESYSIMLGFAVFVTFGGGTSEETLEFSFRDAHGQVEDYKGDIVREWNGERPGDIFSVREVLQWSGIDLDTSAFDDPRDTRRYEGVTMLVQVYMKPSSMWNDQVTYTYKFKELSREGFTIYQPVKDGGLDPNPVGNNKLRGIRMVLTSGGRVGTFSISELVLRISSGIVLSRVAIYIVQLIATYVLPERLLYYSAITDVSEDFSDLVANRRAKQAQEAHDNGIDIGCTFCHAHPMDDEQPILVTQYERELYHYDKASFKEKRAGVIRRAVAKTQAVNAFSGLGKVRRASQLSRVAPTPDPPGDNTTVQQPATEAALALDPVGNGSSESPSPGPIGTRDEDAEHAMRLPDLKGIEMSKTVQ